MEALALTELINKVLDDKQGGDIEVVELGPSEIADYFVIATGKNFNHVRALAEEVEDKLAEQGVFATRREGLREGRWVVIDYDNVIVHIFSADTREFYCLEKLWKSRNEKTIPLSKS